MLFDILFFVTLFRWAYNLFYTAHISKDSMLDTKASQNVWYRYCISLIKKLIKNMII